MARGNRKVKEDVKEENVTVDTNVEGFYRDDVDKFHDEKEKLLLDVERDDASSDEQSQGSGEEVFGLHLSDDSEEERAGEDGQGKEEPDEDDQVATETFYASADEDEEEDQQPEVSDKAWGQSKKTFYNADDVEGMGGSEEEEEAAELEEKEAMMLQKRLAAGLDQEDFAAMDIALEEEREKTKQELQGQKETVAKDLSKLSSAEKMAIIEKDSPELLGLLSEFQDKLSHIANTLQPVLAWAKQVPNLLTEPGEKYLETKLHLCQCYCLNILFYLLLKSSRVPVLSHPVIQVIVKIRQLMDKLHPMDESLNDQLEEALRRLMGGDAMASGERVLKPQGTRGGKEARSKKRKLAECEARGVGVAKGTTPTSGLRMQKVKPASKRVLTAGDKGEEEDPLDYYYEVKAMKEEKKMEAKAKRVRMADVEESEEQDEVTDGKRAINYQIAKNKGLVPKRKKEQRNPRVKHRKKFEKAKIKHKSQVHPVMPELQRYGGERTGIRSTLSRSVRIK
eukprot:Em0008g1059a